MVLFSLIEEDGLFNSNNSAGLLCDILTFNSSRSPARYVAQRI